MTRKQLALIAAAAIVIALYLYALGADDTCSFESVDCVLGREFRG